MKNREIIKQFLFHHGESHPNGCIPWMGATTRKGYGKFWTKYESSGCILAHVFAYILYYKIFPVYNLHHSCRNKWCVNPLHLKEVTKSDHAIIHNGYHTRRNGD